jgi:hypothetical protein
LIPQHSDGPKRLSNCGNHHRCHSKGPPLGAKRCSRSTASTAFQLSGSCPIILEGYILSEPYISNKITHATMRLSLGCFLGHPITPWDLLIVQVAPPQELMLTLLKQLSILKQNRVFGLHPKCLSKGWIGPHASSEHLLFSLGNNPTCPFKCLGGGNNTFLAH